MLTAEGCRMRRARLLHAIARPDCVVLINDPLYVFYLTNLWISPNSLNAYGPCWLILQPDGDATLLVDNFTEGQARQSHVDQVEMVDWYTQSVAGGHRVTQLNASLVELLKKKKWATPEMACCFESMPHEVVMAFEMQGLMRPAVNVTPLIERMRRVKYPDELAEIRRSIGVGEAILEASWRFVKPGAAEHELYCAAHTAALEFAGEPIVMRCGITPTPRAKRNGSPLVMQEGMLVILDMFPLLNGYRCDITNTICVGGKPSKRQQFLFSLCQQAMKAGEEAMKVGVRARDVYAAVNRVFVEADEGHLFPHHAGHAIGLGHPEAPFFIPGDDEVLTENNVFTLEPGLYDPEHGGMRIENNYLVTKSGVETLSKHHIGLTRD